MDRPCSLIMAAVLMIAATGIAAPARSQSAPADEPVRIQGRPLAEWIAGLDDREPAQRMWALRVLRRSSRDRPGGIPGLAETINRVAVQDPDPGVREIAADWLSEMSRLRGRTNARGYQISIGAPTPLRLVDLQGHPVAGAVVGTSFERDRDRERRFIPSGPGESRTSDARGEVSLTLSQATVVYAIRQDKEGAIVGMHLVEPEEVARSITIVMHPACRVRMRIELPDLLAAAARLNAELGDDYAWRGATAHLPNEVGNPSPGMQLSTHSSDGHLEFLLPPGRYALVASCPWNYRPLEPLEIQPGQRLRNLGTIEMPAGRAFLRQGIFPDYHRFSLQSRPAGPDDEAGKGRIRLRRVERLPMDGETTGAMGLAFSPDGRLLATGHIDGNNLEFMPGAVKLWDTRTGKLVATWPVPDEPGGVRALAFSPDGKTLAGPVGRTDGVAPAWPVVLWDVDGRRAPRVLRGHRTWVLALAFSPDGKTLVSGGADKTVILWDVATGREAGRLEATSTRVTSLAFSPDGKTLAIAGGPSLGLWDVPGRRLRARLDAPPKFAVLSVAFSPDGRTLAAVGEHALGGWVRLYDVTGHPPTLRAEPTLERPGPAIPGAIDTWGTFSSVAFSPDGRRLAAVAQRAIGVWDVDGTQRDFIERRIGRPEDRLTFSPDGRWLGIIELRNVSLIDLSPVGP
jgi:Tol biopolymer transport system component